MPFLNDNGGLWILDWFWVIWCLDNRIADSHSFPIKYDFYGILGWIELSFGTGRKMNEKGENINSRNCAKTRPTNRTSNIESIFDWAKRQRRRMFERSSLPTPEPKARGTKHSNSSLECSNIQCNLTLMTPF